MDSKKGGFGILAILAIVAGLIFSKSGIGAGNAMLSTLFKWLGVACIGAGVIIVLLVALVIVAAFASRSKDDNHGTKMEINQIIDARQKDLAKLKSTVTITRMELRKAETKMKDSTSESERQTYAEICENYKKVIAEAEKKIMETDADILLMKQRRDNAFAMMSEAEYLKNDESVLDELEEKAQYEQDYAEAYKSLKR